MRKRFCHVSAALYTDSASHFYRTCTPARSVGAFDVGGLTIAGLLFGVGALVEPILLEIFNPATFDLLKALIEAGLIIVPFVMMVLGVREWAARRRDK